MRAPTPCTQHGCPNLQPCPTHKRTPWEGSTRAKRLPKDWPKRRAQVLKRDRGLCQLRYEGCTGRATEVDHITAGDDHDPSNLRSVCSKCHRTKSLAEAQAARRTR